MATILNDAAALHKQNAIGIAQGGEAVGDKQHGAASEALPEIGENLALSLGIEG